MSAEPKPVAPQIVLVAVEPKPRRRASPLVTAAEVRAAMNQVRKNNGRAPR